MPEPARWEQLQAKAKQPDIGQLIDAAMDTIEHENPSLKGVLPKNYGRADLDKRLLGELVDLIGSIGFTDVDHGSDDVLGKVYEYFLGKFAGQEGRGAGEFYTPRPVVRLLVDMLEPYHGRVFDPCCGSGGMFVQSEEFVLAHGGKRDDISIFGQEFVGTTWRLAKMNLALRGIDANLGDRSDDSFHRDLHADLRADFVLANPPFNKDDWYSESLADDVRWKYARPPASNANFAWVQHFIHHLAPNGRAGFVLANMALSSDAAPERAVRRGIIDDNLVDCIVTLPDKLFTSTPIAVSLWFLDRSRTKHSRHEVLFIDAGRLATPLSRTLNTLSPEDSSLIATTYLEWRESGEAASNDGIARSVSVAEIQEAGYGLLPASYVVQARNDGAGGSLDSALEGGAIDETTESLRELVSVAPDFYEALDRLRGQSDRDEISYQTFRLGDLLEQSKEKLGDQPEPEILTCTEGAGLILQRERFAKRVATEDTTKYKRVRRGDVVYNPYLLWKGSIDQCWIVDEGITSPAYEIFRVKEGVHRSLVGRLVTSPEMIRRYDGISFGTIERRRRAAPENFLNMEVRLPVGPTADLVAEFLELARSLQARGRTVERGMRDLVNAIFEEIA